MPEWTAIVTLNSSNSQLGNFSLDNLLPLASIIDAEPENISSLLDELRIRSFQNEEIVDVDFSPDPTEIGMSAGIFTYYQCLHV
ncbi:MAG: hypothetical protein AAGJ08_14235 [Cyanobacteria bacterium P01_H01_bin.35]